MSILRSVSPSWGSGFEPDLEPVPALHSAAEAAELTFLAGHFTNMKNGAVSLTTFFISG